MSSLANKYISDTYEGLLQNNDDSFTQGSISRLYDGAGKGSCLSLGLSGDGIMVDDLQVGELNYPNNTNGAGRGSFLISLSTNEMGFRPNTSTINEIVNLLYPVGTVIMFDNAIDPNQKYENTKWERIAQGTTLVGVGGGFELGSNVSDWTREVQLPRHYHGVGRFKGRITAKKTVNNQTKTYYRVGRTAKAGVSMNTVRAYGGYTSNGWYYLPTNVVRWGSTFRYVDNDSEDNADPQYPVDAGNPNNDNPIFIIAKEQSLPTQGWVSDSGDYKGRRKPGNEGTRGEDWVLNDGGDRDKAIITTVQYSFNSTGKEPKLKIDITPPAYGVYAWRRLE
jgi:hypothetical protein